MEYTNTEYNFTEYWIPKKGIFYMYKVENDDAKLHKIFRDDYIVLLPQQESREGQLVLLKNFKIVRCTNKNMNDVIANILSVHSKL